MTTIKDIAKLSGVSQGTVSNVLNGKGIVSSEKIKLVEAAAAKLGYTVNERAKLLRKGRSRILAVVLPNIRFRQYVDFYRSFTSCAEGRGYSVSLCITNDNPETERAVISGIRSGMATGVATFASSGGMIASYLEAGFERRELLFVERDQDRPCGFIGFDYAECGRSMARKALGDGLASLAAVTGDLGLSNERAFLEAFEAEIAASRAACSVRSARLDIHRRNQGAMDLLDSGQPQGIIVSNFGFSDTFKNALDNFFSSGETRIYAVSPLFTMPEDDFIKYELNYRLMGKRAAELLIAGVEGQDEAPREILPGSGFRDWSVPFAPRAQAPAGMINVLTLDSPEAQAMRHLSRIFTRSTGVPVNISVSSYDEMHETLSSMDESSVYDVVRLDVTWLSWFAGRILRPLGEISPDIRQVLGTFVEGLSRQYSFVEDELYAVPVSPSAQVLFYRKDLFESTVLRRLYQESHHSKLEPPATFEDYNRIAAFFTRALNPQSPVEFGTTLTLGSTGVAGTEFLTRYFARARKLFDDDGTLLLDAEDARAALDELVEARVCAREKHCAWWTNAAREFAEGQTAMTILYSNFASDLIGRDSRIVGRIGCALVPGGSPIIGGGSLGVTKFSRDPELSLAFIRWMCSEPISSASMLLGGVSACAKAYENYEVVDSYPWLELAKDCFALSRNQRTPSRNFAPFDERRFLSILGMQVKNAISGAINSEEALERAQRAYEKQFPRPWGA